MYWIRSLLDLWGSWGALASFITVLSLGAIASWYNGYMFESHFHRKSADALQTYDHFHRDGLSEYFYTADIRLFNNIDFDNFDRFNMTKEEFKFPSSAIEEMRKLAMEEHMRKRNAAKQIASWYLCQLVKQRKAIITFQRQQNISRKHQTNRRHLLVPGSPLPIPRASNPGTAVTVRPNHAF